MATKMNYRILDSYKIKSKAEMRKMLEDARNQEQDNAAKHRDIDSMICEWRSHNLLYDLHLFRKRTKHVDLEYPQKLILAVGYFILSLFYFHK